MQKQNHAMETFWPSMEMGHISGFSKLAPSMQEKVKITFEGYKKAQPLLDTTDAFTSMPLSNMEAIWKTSIQHAGDGVAKTFFNANDSKALIGGKDFTSLRNDIAVCIFSQGVAQIAKYNFSRTINASAAKEKLKSLINGPEGIALGQALLLQDLINNHGFQTYLNDKQHWIQKMENMLLDEVYIIGTLVKQLAMEDDLPAKMKLFVLKELGSSKIEEILKKWQVSCDKNMVQAVHDFIYKDNILLNISGWMNEAFLEKIKLACYQSHTHSWDTASPTGMVVKTTEITYGAAVRSWLGDGNASRRLNLRTGSNPDNITKHSHVMTPFHCFLSGTQVLLGKGRSIPIQHLKEHDQIVGKNGLIGTISSESVVNSFEEEIPIFGFNDEKEFFLASHPFWTQDGWRAVDAHGAKTENSWLEVGQLSEGDFVRKVTSYQGGKINYEWIEVTNIHFKIYPAGTKVYGVHTREGPRSYHANGYLVFENYPEITTHRVIENMEKISILEQQKVSEHLKEMQPTLEKLLGAGPAKAMASIAEKHVQYKLKNPTKNNKIIPLKEACLPQVNLDYKAGKTETTGYKMPRSVSLMRGHLFVDGAHVADSHTSDDQKVTWTRPVADGKWEHGSVKLHHGRRTGHGFVSLTQNHSDTTSLLSANFIATSSENQYKCYKGVEPETTSKTKTTTKWEDFGGLVMGVDCTGAACKTVGKIKIPPQMDSFSDVGNSVSFTDDKKYQLNVNVNFSGYWQGFLGYTKLNGVFSGDFSTFSGYCIASDGKKYAWKGVIEQSPAAVSMLRVAKSKSLAKSIHDEPHATSTIPSTNAYDSVDGPSIAPMAMSMAAMTNASLSLTELSLLPPPDMDAVHNLTFSLLQKGMKYEMSNDTRKDVLGVERPSPTGDVITVSDKYKAFLGTRFANAYCMFGLSQSTHFEGKITEAEKNKLLFYFNGAEKGCLSQDADYTNANNEFSRVAFLQSCPDLNKYVTSSQGGEYWGKQLYDCVCMPRVLNGLALQATSAETLAIIQKQSMALFCLAPDKDYGSLFYKKILTTKLNEMSSFFQGNPAGADVMKEVFQDSIHQLVVLILSQSDKSSKLVTKELQKQLSAAMEELNIEATEDAEETASAIVSHMEDLIAHCITAFNTKKGKAWNSLITSMNEFFGEHNKWKAFGYLAGTLMFQAMWGASLYFSIKTFMQWKTLKPEQKVALVVDMTQMTLDVVNKVPDMISSFRDCIAEKKVNFKFMEIWSEGNQQPEVVDGIEIGIENGVAAEEEVEVADAKTVNEAMAEAATDAAEDIPETMSNWSKFFRISEGIADGLGFLGSVAGCVVMGFQISRDFKSGAPVAQKALDICQGVTLAVATMAAACGLFLDLACLPIIGIACAVIGIAFAIASMFIHRDPPKPKPTKVEVYVTDTGKPAVDAMPAPTDAWLKDYHKKHSKKT